MSFDEAVTKPAAGFAAENSSAEVSSIPARRYSAVIVCDLLRMIEAAIVGLVAWRTLSLPHLVPLVTSRYAAIVALGIALLSLLGIAFTKNSPVDNFASRLSLLPSALMVGAFAAIAAWIGGATPAYILLCAASLFACVYVAKIPTALLKSYLCHRGMLSRLVALVGDDPAARHAGATLLMKRQDIRIVHFGTSANFTEIQALVRDGKLDEVVLCGPVDPATVDAMIGLAVTLVRIFPEDCNRDAVSGPNYCRYGSWGAPTAILSLAPLRDWRAIYKRMIDIFGSLAAIILLAPVFLACAIAIKLDSPGPILFMQERAGFRNQRFRMFKFRSMRNDMADKSGAQLTQRNDSRVTKVGNFLRRTSADELPQLFNVLLGDMSMVGPRPHPLMAKAGARLYEDLIPDFYARYRMKPGITGLAQISGYRGNTETEEHLISRFRADQLYVSDWTPLKDVTILFRTVIHLFEGTNAF
jgi:exopolysaccharide biosynthesis polyprenyl glycosylphosphotransferase